MAPLQPLLLTNGGSLSSHKASELHRPLYRKLHRRLRGVPQHQLLGSQRQAKGSRNHLCTTPQHPYSLQMEVITLRHQQCQTTAGWCQQLQPQPQLHPSKPLQPQPKTQP